jgi:hypothetical protein
VGEVDRDVRMLRSRKSIAVETHAPAAGEFRLDVVTRKVRAIIADAIDLIRARTLDVIQIERSGHGHNENVAVLALRAAEMEMGKAEDDSITGVAKAGFAPIKGLHIGPDLNQAVWNCGANKGVAAPVDANKWIDVAHVVLRSFKR